MVDKSFLPNPVNLRTEMDVLSFDDVVVVVDGVDGGCLCGMSERIFGTFMKLSVFFYSLASFVVRSRLCRTDALHVVNNRQLSCECTSVGGMASSNPNEYMPLTRRPECETAKGWREIKWQDKWEIIFGHEIANMIYCPTPSSPVMCNSDAKPELFFSSWSAKENQTERRESRKYFYYIAKRRRKREIYISFLRIFRFRCLPSQTIPNPDGNGGW